MGITDVANTEHANTKCQHAAFRSSVFTVALMACSALYADDAPEPLHYAVAATTLQGRPVERADGSIVAASCRPGSCQEKGMIWASGDGVVVGALVHFYYKDPKAPMSPALLVWSRDVNASSLPHGFTMALTE
jgi:hypothetical protein